LPAPPRWRQQAANLLTGLDEATYWNLPPLSRRLVNQTVLQRILVHQDLETTVERTELGQRFEDARSVADPARSYERRSTTNPNPLSGGPGSNVLPLERARGIEPPLQAWEACVLPLNYARWRP
jgi:hypothetical protein